MPLYLIPTPLADDTAAQVLPPQVVAAVARLPYFLVENVRTARRFVKSVAPARVIEDIRFGVIDKDSTPAEVRAALEPLLREGLDAGVLSEAGCPGIADPGAALAAEAHRLGLRVVPLVGPSSLLLALMASGLNGQQFAFHGYLPIEKGPRATAIKALEREAQQRNQSQLFIETPYRNGALFLDLLAHLQPATRLCVAADVTGAGEFICTRPVSEWRRQAAPELHKIPTVFVLGV
ncbi:SAM-dependent methyltransferase [Hymenobacter sp. PAMC 26628]|uniref:SAM-dependent methyltransferase n=1 Tax=Hymenobacter sp. PAMC 26628 TaxID=1484118 RepID=UPI0007705254|nr:SAM-dependent methyltransferase [Hymenobacter sp. PAMC 26628]AMJ67278.1 SAM-dependent methyltransferase [Hymenobacter sp. PAMC 26628]